MGLTDTVLREWLKSKAPRVTSYDEALNELTRMYGFYKLIEKGEMPDLKLDGVLIFRKHLEYFRTHRPPSWKISRHEAVLRALDEAYPVVRAYAANRDAERVGLSMIDGDGAKNDNV